jgi:glycosyltransferase involved in cell wall biosynthesis
VNGRPHSVAVVIPLYNKAPWVGKTLESVLNQSHQPDEIIVVDDGSTDEGPSIVRTMAGARVQLHRTQSPRSGPSAARNVGIRSARSEWIALLDADDLWSPEYLARVADCTAQHPDVGCVFSSRMMLGADTSFQHPPSTFGTSERRLDLAGYLDLWITTGAVGLSPMTSSSSVIRTAVLKKAGLFPEAHWRGEDKDTWLRVVAAADVIFLPEALASYRRDLPGQLNDGPAPVAPPHVFTAVALSRSPDISPDLRAKLRRLANQELWLYARRRRLRPFDKAALGIFDAGRDPFRFLMMIGLYFAGAIRGTWREPVPAS